MVSVLTGTTKEHNLILTEPKVLVDRTLTQREVVMKTVEARVEAEAEEEDVVEWEVEEGVVEEDQVVQAVEMRTYINDQIYLLQLHYLPSIPLTVY